MRDTTIFLKSSLAAAVLLLLVPPISAKKNVSQTPPKQQPTHSYDASRDPAQDLKNAIAEATRTHRRILLEVGGDWCMYCNMMDATFASHPQLRQLRENRYVYLRVNYSKENPNAAFLSQYPKIADYPHFFVLDSNGKLVHSQPTHPFEHGKTYNASKIESFLSKWAQVPKHWLNLQS